MFLLMLNKHTPDHQGAEVVSGTNPPRSDAGGDAWRKVDKVRCRNKGAGRKAHR